MRNLSFVPRLFRLPARLFMVGALRPKVNVLGVDFAGEIVAVGKDVGRFRGGDQVFGTPGTAGGAHAEYICLPEDGVLAAKPANTTWEEAAAIPLAGNTALHFIRDLGNVQAGQKILINGASGGIGTFAVQPAKYYGAEVTGVCSTTNLDMVKSLGADRVIDYSKEDLTKSNESYDVIFDVVGKLSFSRCRHLLKEGGIYLVTIPTLDAIRNSERVTLGDAAPSVDNLLFLKELIEAGKLRTVIDRCYRLDQIVEAFRYVERGHKKGSVVIIIGHRKPIDGGGREAVKALLVLYSFHHHNTEKVANAFASILGAEIKGPRETDPDELQAYDLIGFGSGIYSDQHHRSLLELADRLPQVTNGRAFLFSTSGAPAFALDGGALDDYVETAHSPLREKLQAKGYVILDEFMCAGWNTNKFLKLFGGINKGRPNAEDLERAEAFAQRLRQSVSHGVSGKGTQDHP